MKKKESKLRTPNGVTNRASVKVASFDTSTSSHNSSRRYQRPLDSTSTRFDFKFFHEFSNNKRHR